MGIGQRPARRGALAGVPVRIRFTGTSSFLPESVRGTAGTANHPVRHVARREVRAQLPPDARDAARRVSSAPSRSATNRISSSASSRWTTTESATSGSASTTA